MVARLSLSLLLFAAGCGLTAGAGAQGARSRSNRGPTITRVTITPEHPEPGEEATANVVIRDPRGVEGFRVSFDGQTKDVSCENRRECSKTFTRTIPDTPSRTLTLTIIARNTAGHRSRVDREIVLAGGARARKPEPGRPRDTPTGDHEVFLRSGFEAGVTLRAPQAAGREWEQYLTGADQGYDWSRSLPQRSSPKNRITYLVSADKDLKQYADTRIETVTGRDGRPTRALYMELKKQDPSAKSGTRSQYGIYPEEGLKQGYARFWLKLQPDLASAVLPPGTKKSRQVMEWKETGSPRADFRWGIYIVRDRNANSLFWSTRAQFGDLQKSPKAWECDKRVPVPIGEWFLFEVFWKLDRRDGRVWAAANGKTIVDYQGQTQKDSGLFVWWPFKVYVGSDLQSFSGRSLYQWVDDVEFASAPPAPLPPVARDDSSSCRSY